ncbi:hypothetical protein KDJ21_007135 [Metabacillus litoralis]|uniref:hypothetical protein n=1 Tax=Metabacillus litoralis TaxID=152268 RepID=UPI001E5A5E28|nr:hypothetical protein [Metabacillus litoralis]UHA61424.1 hypothetical protein KDJ21_007135 [Metabacillus litoralis]
MSNPRNIFIKKVLETSQSGDFEIAMSEWVCLGKKTNLDNDFYSNCDLCGAAIYKTNYIICNVKTMRIHSIGCECIKRFKSSYPSELVSKLKRVIFKINYNINSLVNIIKYVIKEYLIQYCLNLLE